jgi:hypothetical protein
MLNNNILKSVLDSVTQKWTAVGLPTPEYWNIPSVNNTGTVMSLNNYGTQGFKYQ